MILRDFATDNYDLTKQEEVQNRAKKIELLEENLEILKDEYYFHPKFEARHLLAYDNTFGDIDMESGSILSNQNPGKNSPIYNKFDENILKINQLSSTITQGIPVLKENMEYVHLGSLKVSDNLTRLSKRELTNYKEIREKQNSFKEKLYRIREGHMFVVDVILVLFFISMISVMVSIAK